jgi:hypothetical protein
VIGGARNEQREEDQDRTFHDGRALSTGRLGLPDERLEHYARSARPIVLPASGVPIKWTREDGEKFDVSGILEHGTLVQTYRADDGQRVNRWSVAGSRMILDVTVTSPRLENPLRYKLVYKRG